jgi:hypothetical protein
MAESPIPPNPTYGDALPPRISAWRIFFKPIAIVACCVFAIVILYVCTGDARGRFRTAVNRTNASNHLKHIVHALHDYESEHGGLPPAATCDADGKPLLSWRVAILPYLDEGQLHKRFQLDEAWDGPNNRQLLARMPQVYDLPGINKNHDIRTYFRVYVGGGAAFNVIPAPGPCLCEFADGTGQTLLVVAAEDAVEWTKPDELTYDPKRPPPRPGYHFGDHQHALVSFADGTIRELSCETDEVTLHALITRSGGETIERNRY